jgi:hypothetical protein
MAMSSLFLFLKINSGIMSIVNGFLKMGIRRPQKINDKSTQNKMNRQKLAHISVALLVAFTCLTSFRENRKPHLIVGLWEITEVNTISLISSKSFINQAFFGSDELLSDFSFTNKKGKFKEKGLRLAYKIYEDSGDFKKPVIYFVNTCNKKIKLLFTIEKLTKDTLELKYVKDLTTKNIQLNKETLIFERIGGPPENMMH